jgi:amidohydrolase
LLEEHMALPLTGTRPAGPFADGKARIAAAIDGARDEILDLSHRIHADPEPAFEEVRASAWVADAIARHGFTVERPVGSLATAVRGLLRGGRGGDRPRIGILAEYDALPGLGHGCGHNSMAASGVGAAIGLAAVRDELPGEVVFLGTPAEERGSGKQVMIDDGLFAGLDAALLYHPCDRDHVSVRMLASVDAHVTFSGRSSHAAADPWNGTNALDALVALFASVGLWRQQLRPEARVHGIVVEGGTAANIIPDRAVGWFMLRSPDQEYFEWMKERFRAMVAGATMATGTSGGVVYSGGSSTMNENPVLLDLFDRNLRAYGVVPGEPDPTYGSSDMGNVSWVVPTIHPELAICDEGTSGHSIEFRDAARSPRGDEVTLLAATVVAQTAYDLFADPGMVEAAARAFAESR